MLYDYMNINVYVTNAITIYISIGKAPDVIQYCNSFGERLSKLSPEKAVEAMRRMESILTELE